MATGPMTTGLNTSPLYQWGKGITNLKMEDDDVYQLLTKQVMSAKLSQDGQKQYYQGLILVKRGHSGRALPEGGDMAMFYTGTTQAPLWDIDALQVPLSFTGKALRNGAMIRDVTSMDVQKAGMDEDWKEILMQAIRGQHQGYLCFLPNALTGSGYTAVVDCGDFIDPDGGQIVDGYNLSGTKQITSAVIASYEPSTKTITFTSQPTCDAWTGLVIEGSYNKMWYGLKDIVNDNIVDTLGPQNARMVGDYVCYKGLNSYASVLRASYRVWKSTVLHPGGNGASSDFDPAWIGQLVTQFQQDQKHRPNWNVALCHPLCLEAIYNAIESGPTKRTTIVRKESETFATIQGGKVILNHAALGNGALTLIATPGFMRHSIMFLNTGKIKGQSGENEDALALRWSLEPNFVPAPGGHMGIFHHDMLRASGSDNYYADFMGEGGMVAYPSEHALLCGIAHSTNG